MIFQTIDGVKIADIQLIKLTEFLTEHVFFRFMDNGRAGMQSGCKDVVDNVLTWFEEQQLMTAEFKTESGTIAGFNAHTDKLVKECIDGFITGGSNSIKRSINMFAKDIFEQNGITMQTLLAD